MESLVECVPNFSEGRDQAKLQAITQAITSVEGITLLDVDPGADTNRTVVTFVGPPAAVEEAAFKAIEKAAQVIDMRLHQGAHARMGATDVCPFVPLRGVSLEECVALSKRVAQRVGTELEIPVYLYEYSAQTPERKNLAVIRAGEYEGLEQKLQDPQWQPDYGPARFNATAGATVMGVREFLIAYNINLNTRDKRLATDMAFELREKGRSLRRPHPGSPNLLDGEIVRYAEDHYPCAFCGFVATTPEGIVQHNAQEHDFDLPASWSQYGYAAKRLLGRPVKKPGLFKHVKAVGWYIDEYQRAQISINFTNYKQTPIHEVFDAACRLAEERGVRVTGSELVGLIPLEALLAAGRHYLRRQRRTTGVPEAQLVETAVQSLGLRDIVPFDPEEKIIEYAVQSSAASLVHRSVTALVDEVSSSSPAPGGGSIAALTGSLAAALVSMVGALTHEKKGFEKVRKAMETVGTEAQELKAQLLNLVDADTQAFQEVLAAHRLPATTPEEKATRQARLQAANRRAIQVPLETARLAFRVLELAQRIVTQGNPNSVSDVGVAAETALAGVRGACLNVLINLSSVKDDPDFYDQASQQISAWLNRAPRLHGRIHRQVLKIIKDL